MLKKFNSWLNAGSFAGAIPSNLAVELPASDLTTSAFYNSLLAMTFDAWKEDRRLNHVGGVWFLTDVGWVKVHSVDPTVVEHVFSQITTDPQSLGLVMLHRRIVALMYIFDTTLDPQMNYDENEPHHVIVYMNNRQTHEQIYTELMAYVPDGHVKQFLKTRDAVKIAILAEDMVDSMFLSFFTKDLSFTSDS